MININGENRDVLTEDKVFYITNWKLTNGTLLGDGGFIKDIRFKPSEGLNITWLDMDNDHHLSIGDAFIINKNKLSGEMDKFQGRITFSLYANYPGDYFLCGEEHIESESSEYCQTTYCLYPI